MSRSYKRGISKCNAGRTSHKTYMKRHSARKARKAIKQATLRALRDDTCLTSSALLAIYNYPRKQLTWDIDDWTWAAYHDVQEYKRTYISKTRYDPTAEGPFRMVAIPKADWSTWSMTCFTHIHYYHAYSKSWWRENQHRYTKDGLNQFRK